MTQGQGGSENSGSARLLNLLDQAYEASFKPDNFEQLYRAAENLFFDDVERGVPAADLNAQGDIDTVLAAHVQRIETMLSERESDKRAVARNINTPRLASIVIDPASLRCEGNEEAEAFFELALPAGFSQLPLAPRSQTMLRDIIRLIARGESFDNRTLLVERLDDVRSHVAKAVVLSNVATGAARKLSVTFAFIDWTPQRLAFCHAMLDLSSSEIEVLSGLLMGQTQAQIAQARNRSAETVKVQSKSILRKAGCTRMADVLNLVTTYGLLVEPDDTGARPAARGPFDIATPDRMIATDGGRMIACGYHGDPDGHPVLFVHGLAFGPFFPASMDEEFKRRGLRVIAPSRPGFGRSHPPADWARYEETVIEDALAVLKDAGAAGRVTMVVHQGGVSGACRTAGRLGARVAGMVMVGAGIPIDEDRHLEHMSLQVRVAALGAKYAPRTFEMIARITVATWLRKGVRAYLEDLFSNSPADLAALNDPDLFPLYRAGVLHMIDQGTRAFVVDGTTAMVPWDDDLLALTCPRRWVHGTADPIMRHDFVAEYLAEHTKDRMTVIEGGASNLLYEQPHTWLDVVEEFTARL